jgi:hypothetical protein
MRPGITRAKKPSNFLKEASPRMRGRNSNSFSLNSFRMINSGINNFFSLVRAATFTIDVKVKVVPVL